MRALLSVALIAGAGLMVTACNSETTATTNNTTTETTEVVNEGASDTMGLDNTVVENTTTTVETNTTTNAN